MNTFLGNKTLTFAGRVRVILGCMSICLAFMDLSSPITSYKLKWLREWMNFGFGAYGFFLLLILIGIFFLLWAIFGETSKEDKE